MRHIGLICPPVDGHMNPIGTLAHELQDRGHRITLLSVLDMQQRAEQAGFGFAPLGQEEYPLGAVRQETQELGKLAGYQALKFTSNMMFRQTKGILGDGPTIARDLNIDAMIVDQASPAGGALADIVDVPFITVASALYVFRDPHVPPFFTAWRYREGWRFRLRNRFGNRLMAITVDAHRRDMNRYRRKHGLAKYRHVEESFSTLAHISQQPPEFEFPLPNPIQNLHYVGPVHDHRSRRQVDFPYEQLSNKPLIYASMGTLQNRDPNVFRKIAAACEPLDVQLVISLGGGSNSDEHTSLPGNPIVVSFAPQLELIKKSKLVITHAGMNTALECLANGIPMVAIPVTNDQPGVSSRLEWLGAGKMLTLSKMTVDDVRAAVVELLNNDGYQQQAQRLQQDCEAAGGQKRAADIIESILGNNAKINAQKQSLT